ncbi:MAG: peptidylprolyl isomerase [Pararhodobacter sp.]
MTQAKAGDTVHFHYTGSLKDGTVFDSSNGRDPLTFTLGSGQIIPGLERALDGMAVGEQKTVVVPAADAYGDRVDSARQAVPRAQFPGDIPTDPGTRLQMQSPEGQVIPVMVVEATDEHVVLDANHPLAGEDLTFAVEVVAVG